MGMIVTFSKVDVPTINLKVTGATDVMWLAVGMAKTGLPHLLELATEMLLSLYLHLGNPEFMYEFLASGITEKDDPAGIIDLAITEGVNH